MFLISCFCSIIKQLQKRLLQVAFHLNKCPRSCQSLLRPHQTETRIQANTKACPFPSAPTRTSTSIYHGRPNHSSTPCYHPHRAHGTLCPDREHQSSPSRHNLHAFPTSTQTNPRNNPQTTPHHQSIKVRQPGDERLKQRLLRHNNPPTPRNEPPRQARSRIHIQQPGQSRHLHHSRRQQWQHNNLVPHPRQTHRFYIFFSPRLEWGNSTDTLPPTAPPV
ncbi:hypothetical protein HDV57DRAFT_499876 [Trichoderma longibrachiatum]